jgi:hypothetical protein
MVVFKLENFVIGGWGLFSDYITGAGGLSVLNFA